MSLFGKMKSSIKKKGLSRSSSRVSIDESDNGTCIVRKINDEEDSMKTDSDCDFDNNSPEGNNRYPQN